MWVVRNVLRGTLTFKGLGLSIPPRQEVDLDLLGRERAETSPQVQVAFEEGYLQNIYKEPLDSPSTSLTEDAFSARLEEFKRAIVDELRGTLPGAGEALARSQEEWRGDMDRMREIVGDVKAVVKKLQVAKRRLAQQRERVLVDQSLSDAEIRARLSFLEEKERQIEKNFEALGKRQDGGEEGGGDLLGKVDLLSRME